MKRDPQRKPRWPKKISLLPPSLQEFSTGHHQASQQANQRAKSKAGAPKSLGAVVTETALNTKRPKHPKRSSKRKLSETRRRTTRAQRPPRLCWMRL